jgi:hypothetical protein
MAEQILCVTCDNASNNDKMTEALGDLLPAFITSNHARCFTHILNLVAKSLLKQFDVETRLENDDGLNNEERELLDLADNLEAEELTTAQENDAEDGEIDEDDDLEDWVDEVAALTPEEQETLKDSIRPVKTVLVKVCREDMNLTSH